MKAKMPNCRWPCLPSFVKTPQTMTDPASVAAPAAVPPSLRATYRAADRFGFLERAGARIRYAWWNALAVPRGTVVILTGRGEFIEKYATEVVAELLERGFAVAAIDWRGQGLSDRPLQDRGKGHIDTFATYMADLRLFLETVVSPEAPRPVLALCHSMGSHIMMREMAENGSGPFSAALFVAPMTALRREAMLRSVLMIMPEVPAVEERYLFGTGPFVLLAREFASNFVTHDERRYRFTEDWFTADPRLTLGGPTIGWSRQAVRSMAAVHTPGYLERIDIPLLIITAGEDRLIDSRSHAPLVARLKHGEHFTIGHARHEIMMETDEIRALFWEAFDRLVKGVLS